MSELPDILLSVYYKEQADVVNTILDDEKLLNNKNVLGSLRGWLLSMEGMGAVRINELERVNKLLKTFK